jgi:type VI secretion system secreted protein VgrG
VSSFPPLFPPLGSLDASDLPKLVAKVAALEARLAALERMISTTGAGVTITSPNGITLSTPGTVSIKAGLACSVSVATSLVATVGKSVQLHAGDGVAAEVGKKLTVAVADEIGLTTGNASLVLKKSGDIAMDGNNITIEGSGRVNVKASSDLVLKGSKIREN